jgi:eukaryotic-like serine/threonine-protein kinase
MTQESAVPVDKASPIVKVGEVLRGKYRVDRFIGEGGMGVVVAATHLALDRSVAIKLLNAKSSDSDEAIERFTREARAAARIQSAHVGRVLDVDQLPSGAPFIVMEFLEGHDLARELRDGRKLPFGDAVRFVLQACEAIAEAHAAGIVHRDLKPANLFLAQGGGATSVKVLDFGISKITRREAGADITANKALTNPTSMLGSPLYMSPEQMKASTEVDARTDIWSLGVILYESITGRSPFDAKTIPMICAAVLSQEPAPFDDPDVPPTLERVVRRCLEKDADKRYRDVAHFVRALTPFAPEQAALTLDRITKLRDERGLPAQSPASLPPPPSKEGSHTITSWGEKPAKEPQRRWWPIWVAGAAVVAIGGGVLWQLTREDKRPVNVVATSTVTTDEVRPSPRESTSETAPASARAPATLDPAAEATAPSPSVAEASAAASGPRAPGPPRPGVGRLPTAKVSSGRTAGFGGRE